MRVVNLALRQSVLNINKSINLNGKIKMEHNTIESFIFRHPFTCMIAGPSKSGKTTLLKEIILNKDILISEPPQRIVYCYSRWQDNFDQLKKQLSFIEFVQGLPDIDMFDEKVNNLLILDDLMKECGKDNSIYDIFTIDSHQKNISVFFLTQNLFPKEKNARTIRFNCNYIIVLNNLRDRAQIFYHARQMFPDNVNFMQECYNDAVESQPYGYLFLDFYMQIFIKGYLNFLLNNQSISLIFEIKI